MAFGRDKEMQMLEYLTQVSDGESDAETEDGDLTCEWDISHLQNQTEATTIEACEDSASDSSLNYLGEESLEPLVGLLVLEYTESIFSCRFVFLDWL